MPKLQTHSAPWREAPERAGAVSELGLDGFIDAANYGTFEKGLEKVYASGARSLIVDCARVHYINSTGISAVVRYFELFRDRGGVLCLANVAKSVGLSMHLLGVTSFVPFLKDVEAAREYVAAYDPKNADSMTPPALVERAAPGEAGSLEGAPSGGMVTALRIPLRRRSVASLENARVLVVTPIKNRFTRILRLRFKHLNGEYFLLHDVREALDRYDEISPDLVIIDDRVDPRGEFVNRIKIQKERSLTSVVKLYGKEQDVAHDLDFKIWENDYLVEPFEVLELFTLTEAELVRVPKDRKVLQQQLHFEFKTTAENVEKGCKLIDLVVHQSMAIQEDAMALYAAVKEGIDNAVRHGNTSDPAKTVDVNLLVDQKKITVLIEDEGKGFDYEYYLQRLNDEEAFEKAKRRILEEGTRGGLGILLMYKCADRLEYSGAGNILRLEKNL